MRWGGSDGSSLYLGSTTVRVKSGVTTGIRTYTVAGVAVAERVSGTGGGLWWLSPDPVGTVGMRINASTGGVTRRWMDPYGVARGTAVTWPSNLGYLNAPASATGLTQLGARQYDPNLGRFITIDPVLDTAEPRHANAYAYSYSSPVSYSDPTGLISTNRYVTDGGKGYTSTGKTGTGKKNPTPPSPPPPGNKPVTTNVGGTTATFGSYDTGGCGSSYNPCGAPTLTPEQRAQQSSISLHGALTTLGLVPGIGEVFDGIDALVCLAESDLVCAGLSAASMAPFLGWGSAGAKYVRLGGEMIEAGSSASRGADDLVNLASEARTTHILTGEVRPNGSFGGGHKPGTGYPGKSEFPPGWSDGQIMHQVSDVATDPSVVWRSGSRPGDYFANGTRDGVEIEVLIRNDEIWTGYPTNVPRNPR